MLYTEAQAIVHDHQETKSRCTLLGVLILLLIGCALIAIFR